MSFVEVESKVGHQLSDLKVTIEQFVPACGTFSTATRLRISLRTICRDFQIIFTIFSGNVHLETVFRLAEVIAIGR